MQLAEKSKDLVGAALGGKGGNSSTTGNSPQDSDGLYKIQETNWYKTLPYGFTFRDREAKEEGDSGTVTFYLPITPSNIQVTTQFATNVITTLYGVVEEHSEVRYYDMVISGTTGFAPRYKSEKNSKGGPLAKVSTGSGKDSTGFINPIGRSSFEGNSIDLGGFLPEVTNVISQVKNAVSDIGDFINGGPKNVTGIKPSESGYFAFHNFYKFLLKYKQDAAGVGKLGTVKRRAKHPLQFLNYKDGIKYDCVPTDFTLTRSAESPMLYNYSIKMRCYNLRSVNETVQEQSQLTKLGLGEIDGQSLFSSLAGAAGGAAALVAGFI
jgi:hypothetical protein